jgi:Trypsin
MADSTILGPRVGRLLTSVERAARMADETAFSVPDEIRRTAFAVGDRHILTAWHCIRDAIPSQSLLWFRIRSDDDPGNRTYIYIPVRLSNYDASYDVAALTIDDPRLEELGLTVTQASALLAHVIIPLDVYVHDNDTVRVIGFPLTASGADSDPYSGTVVETRLPLGNVTGLKVFLAGLAAASPADPHGLSGGPVLRLRQVGDLRQELAVGVIRLAPKGMTPETAAGGCVTATRIEDIIARLPEAAVALQATHGEATRPHALVAHGRKNVLITCHATWRWLRDSVVEVNDPELGQLVGWPHFFDEPLAHRRPTAIGTAYGLKLALVLGEQDFRPDRSQLTETLWKLRRADGGWGARTGTEVSRPEVTALVLGALSSSGFDPGRLAIARAVFEESLAAGLDAVAMERTNIVSAIMRGLMRSSPRSPQLTSLRMLLLSGAIQDSERSDLLCWSSRLKGENEPFPPPSVVHTAQAVIALLRARYVLGEDAQSRTAVDQAVRWLRAHRGLANQTEQIRRFITADRWETLTVRHFTAAWVARALLLAPASSVAADPLLDEAMRQVWRACNDGLWEWDDGERPLWMSYQGSSVIRDFALHTSMEV